MKISELIKLHGLPVKVKRRFSTAWLEVLCDKRKNKYPGFNCIGEVIALDDSVNDFEIYVEPKPKKKLYGYLSKEIGTSAESIYSDSYVVSLLTKEIESKHMYLVRAPQFDCEIDG